MARGTGSGTDAKDSVDAVPGIGVGMLGYAFMGRAHANAYRTIPYMTRPPLVPRLVALAGRSEEKAAEAAQRYGFASYTTDWRDLLADDSVGMLDICGPNSVHAEASIAAAKSGRHVLCEKPLGRNAAESYEAWHAAQQARVKHMCAFNYRFVPAVRLAKEIIDAGDLGEIRHFRGRYLQESLADPDAPMRWRLSREIAGSGALGDLGSHVIDLARYLVGEVSAITGATRTFVPERPGGKVDVDDAFEAIVEFDGGAVGTVEASRFCIGRKNSFAWEINGSKGSIAFDLERLNELQVAFRNPGRTRTGDGFRTVLVSEAEHPFSQYWWPPGHVIGWEHTFIHEIHHFLSAVAENRLVGPHGATFEDGYRAAEICDAVLRSAASGSREQITYRGG
ncbi:MAG TPA: Gfo/Idh/MocA family oxidoreductase [Thermoleophilia bacterium]